MANPKVGRTASGANVIKCAEQFVPAASRLFDDPISLRLLPATVRFLMGWRPSRDWFMGMVEKEAPGTYGGLVCRTRFIDDAVRAAVRDGIASVVILGAGLDTRPYRLPEIKGMEVREVDLPSVLRLKRRKLGRVLAPLPGNVRYVPIDFNRQSIDEALHSDGFRMDQRTFFIWEGVSQYLEAHAVTETLAFVAKCASRSRLAFTYVPAGIIDGSERSHGAEQTVKRMARSGHAWLTGFEPAALDRTLAGNGLRLMIDAGPEYYYQTYLAPLGRRLQVFELERAAIAETC